MPSKASGSQEPRCGARLSAASRRTCRTWSRSSCGGSSRSATSRSPPRPPGYPHAPGPELLAEQLAEPVPLGLPGRRMKQERLHAVVAHEVLGGPVVPVLDHARDQIDDLAHGLVLGVVVLALVVGGAVVVEEEV